MFCSVHSGARASLRHPSMTVLPDPCRMPKQQRVQRHTVMGCSQREKPPFPRWLPQAPCCALEDSDNLNSPRCPPWPNLCSRAGN